MNLIQLSNGDWVNPAKVTDIYTNPIADKDGEYKTVVHFKGRGVCDYFKTLREAESFRDDCAKRINAALNPINDRITVAMQYGEPVNHLK